MKEQRFYWAIIAFLLLCFPFSLVYSQSTDATKVFEDNKESVISFVTMDNNKIEVAKGTGFFVGQEILATSFHLVSAANNAEGKNFQGKKVKFEGIIAADKTCDVAILKVKRKAPALQVSSLTGLEIGNSVFAVGSNEAGEIVVNEGKVNSILELSPELNVADVELDIFDSFSGAPVFSTDGKVVGMVIFLDLQKKIIVPVDMIPTLLRQGPLTKFKDWIPVEHFETLEGSYFAARVFAALEETARAEKYLKKVVEKKPDEMDAHLLLADVYSKQRNYSSAVAAYNKILELDPNRSDTYMDMGMTYLKMMRWKEAIPPLEKTIQLNPENKGAHFYVAKAYEELRDFEKAAEAYKGYLSTNPEQKGEAFHHLGLCQIELGQFEEAAISLKEALKENPQDLKINYKLGQAYQSSGQYDEAAEVYYLLAKLTPEDAKTYFNAITRMYDEAQMPEKAIEAARRIIATEPDNAGAHYNLGYMYVKLDKYSDAVEAFNKVVGIDPNMEYAYLQLGFCYSKLKQYSKSVEALERMVKVFPENVDGWMGIGIGLMQQRKFSLAIEPLERVIELNPGSGVAHYNLAVVYLNLHDRYSAREQYKKLADIDPALAKKLEKLF